MAIVYGYGANCGAALVEFVTAEQNPEVSLKDIAKAGYKVTFYTWCDAKTDDFEKAGGHRLRNYIKEHKLGHVTASPGWHMNLAHGPKSLKMYIWRVDPIAWAKWKEEHLNNDPQKVRNL